MSYQSYFLNLSDGKKQSLAKAYKDKEAITLRLANNQLERSDATMLTKSQINKIRKAITNGTGVDLKISMTQIQKGGFLFSTIIPLLSKVLPYASKAVGPLATGAISGLSTLGVNKLLVLVNKEDF